MVVTQVITAIVSKNYTIKLFNSAFDFKHIVKINTLNSKWDFGLLISKQVQIYDTIIILVIIRRKYYDFSFKTDQKNYRKECYIQRYKQQTN